MADNDYIHTAQVLKAAAPYLDTGTNTTITLVSSFMELMGCLRNLSQRNLAACGFEEQKEINIESLLTGIRPVCNPKEREFVDRILGIFNAKRMYETYSTYMTAMQAMQGSSDEDNDSNEYNDDDSNEYNDDDSNKQPSDDTEQEHSEESNDTEAKSTNGNDNMMDMLKGMVPPEQVSTIENLSMLFNMMSYDNNNSKPDEE